VAKARSRVNSKRKKKEEIYGRDFISNDDWRYDYRRSSKGSESTQAIVDVYRELTSENIEVKAAWNWD